MQEFNPSSQGNPEAVSPREKTDVYNKELIGKQLDVFADKHGLKNLRDRLRIGLNEVGILAFDWTNKLTEKLIQKTCDSPEESKRVYQDLVDICVGMQESGPWAYAKELANPDSPEMKAWFMLAGAETMGYERERDLNDAEFTTDVKRIEGHLQSAIKDPEDFFQASKEHLIKKAEESIRFGEDDPEHRVPIGEGFASFLPMAIKGYESGVVQDAEGWLFVGAREEIEDARIESTGLEKQVAPDERNPNRMVTYFVNDKGQKVIKKLHPGLLIVLSRSFDLATSVVKALNDKQDVIDVASNALGHIRVMQTTEKARESLGMEDDRMPKGFLRLSKDAHVSDTLSTSTELTRPREDFYTQLLNIRALYVYADALKQLKKKRAEQNKSVSESDKELLGDKTRNKMEQKVDELRYVNRLIAEQLDSLPENIHSVVDMAGGAGDLGLAVTTELLSRGKDITHTEIVDPQEGVAEFMETIIDHLPFRDTLEKIVEHNTGYLQDAHITPDSMVVAKHACGTLTDDIISQWRESESSLLVAMTCCQGKAAHEPARYGFGQKEWEKLCQESDLTNTQIPDAPGKGRDRALAKLEEGNRAMKKLDMARVEYLRRHGFKAELSTTDEFPKGDVIIARRLPKTFMKTLEGLQDLEHSELLKFDARMMQIDLLAAGRAMTDEDKKEFGEGWSTDDFSELTRRFIAPAFEQFKPVEAKEDQEAKPDAGQDNKEAKDLQKKRMQEVLHEYKGRVDLYIAQRAQQAGKAIEKSAFAQLVEAIKNKVLRGDGQSAEQIRQSVDEMMSEMGY